MESVDYNLSTPLEEGGISSDERQWGMLSHVSTFLGHIIPFVNIVAPLIFMTTYRDESEFVTNHAKEALNFQITLILYYFISAVLILVIVGIILLPIVYAFSVVVTIIAAIKASAGKEYKYPLSIRFVK